MAKQNIDWSNLGFGYIKTNERNGTTAFLQPTTW